jgi:hypothetical protein
MVECVSSLLLHLPILPLFCDRHIFGTRPEGDDDDENRPPTMVDTIRAKRAARKAANNRDRDHVGDQNHNLNPSRNNYDNHAPSSPLRDRQNLLPRRDQY